MDYAEDANLIFSDLIENQMHWEACDLQTVCPPQLFCRKSARNPGTWHSNYAQQRRSDRLSPSLRQLLVGLCFVPVGLRQHISDC